LEIISGASRPRNDPEGKLSTLFLGKRLFYPYIGVQDVIAPTFSGEMRAR